MRKFVGKCPTQKCVNIRHDKIRQIDAYIWRKMSNTKCVNVRRDKVQQNIAWENAQIERDTIKQSLSWWKQAIGILSHNIGLFSFLITNNDSLDCNILISLLPEGKTVEIASKQGFLAPGLEKWTKVVQARILVKNGRSSTPGVDCHCQKILK